MSSSRINSKRKYSNDHKNFMYPIYIVKESQFYLTSKELISNQCFKVKAKQLLILLSKVWHFNQQTKPVQLCKPTRLCIIM